MKNQTTAITMTRKERIAQDKKAQPKKMSKVVLSFALAISTIAVVPAVTASAADCGCVEYSGSYIVKKGDTMYAIAKKHGLKAEQLMDANFTASSNIYVGQKLMIPSKNQSWHGDKEQTLKLPNGVYTVVSGDTLYSISNRTGLSVAEIKTLNGLKSDAIRVGQSLKINGTVVETEKTPEVKKVQQTTFATYVVKPGDTKYSLEKKFGKTITFPKTTLKAGEKLSIKGKVLVIPNADFALNDGRVIEVVSGSKYYPVNVYEGNHQMEGYAYRTDRKLTFVVVRVGERNELVSYSMETKPNH